MYSIRSISVSSYLDAITILKWQNNIIFSRVIVYNEGYVGGTKASGKQKEMIKWNIYRVCVCVVVLSGECVCIPFVVSFSVRVYINMCVLILCIIAA